MSSIHSSGSGSSGEKSFSSESRIGGSSLGGGVIGGGLSFALGVFLDAALSLLGLALSAYALRHHLSFKAGTSAGAVCNVNATVSCDAVAASPYSEIAGIPLGVFGIAFFASLLVLNVMRTAASRSGFIGRMSSQSHAVLVTTGCLVSLVLGGISLFAVKSLCLVCLGIYASCFGLLVTLFAARAQIARPFRISAVIPGLLLAAAVTGIAAFSYGEFMKARTDARPSAGPANAQSISQGQPFPQQPVRVIPLSRSAYSGAGEDYRYGSEQAKVVIHEFVDFQCPGCAVLASTIKVLKDRYASRVLFVFRNYPLDRTCNRNISGKFHEHSCLIATMARCAGQYGKFWEYQDLAFAGHASASVENAEKWARAVGLKPDAIATCRNSKDILEKLKDDVAVGDSIGVTGTPAIFINGAMYNGDRSVDGLSQAIESALAVAR